MIIERMKETRPGETICLSYEECEEVLRKVDDLEERVAIMSEGGWHPVSESPKETDDYIVRIDCGAVQVTSMRYYIASLNKWGGEDKITHWMPLPEPPKGCGQE